MKYFDLNMRDPNELKKIYRRLAFQLHPDTGGTKEEFQQLTSEYEKMIEIIEREARNTHQQYRTREQTEVVNGFNWEIEETPIYNQDGSLIVGYKAIWNGKTKKLLSVAKSTYTPTTNARFWDMVEFIKDISGFEIHAAHTLDEGKKVLAGLKKTENSNMIGLEFKEYIVLGNAHDYSSAFFVGSSHTLMRCSNVFTSQNKQLKAYHTTGHNSQLKQIKGFLAGYEEVRAKQRRAYEDFERFKINTQQKDALIRHALSIDKDTPIDKLSRPKYEQVRALNASIRDECRDLGANLLGLFQGVTHYSTHKMKVKEPVFGNTFGSQANINARAWEFCHNLQKHG